MLRKTIDILRQMVYYNQAVTENSKKELTMILEN